MAKIKLWYPVGASAEFDFEKPKGWAKFSVKAKRDYAMANMDRVGYLCHHCENHFESDFEALTKPDGSYYDMEFYEVP